MRWAGRVAVLLVVVTAGCGGGDSAFNSLPDGQDAPTTQAIGPEGVLLVEVLPPDESTIIATAAFGEVFDRRLIVRLADDAGPAAADDIAAAVGGTVSGRIEEFLIAEIELPEAGEDALTAALAALEAHPAVGIVTPSSPVPAAREAAPMPCGPLDSPALQQGDLGDQYSLIGVDDAWRLVRAAGLPLAKPSVGVVDGFGAPVGYHGGYVEQTLNNSDPNAPPGILDAVLGDDAASVSDTDVFGFGDKTSVTSYLSGVKQLVNPPFNATVVNLSLGGAATPGQQALVRQFLRDLAVSHPQVVVVAAAGNDATDLAAWSPGGLNEPNLVTVGGLDHQGERWLQTCTDAAGVQKPCGSNYVGTGGEVTLSAIARDAFTGLDAAGEPVVQSGTSFAAPQVTAAAAILQALDPTLTAAEIKQLLVDSAATEIANPDINQRITAVDPALGGRVLRIDNAVYKLMSERLGVTVPRNQLIAKGTLNVRARPADDDPLTYVIRATAPGGGDGVTVEIVATTNSQGALLPNQARQNTQDNIVRWRWLFTGYGESAQVTLTRIDTGACARVTLTAVEPTFAYAGAYEGSVAYAQYQTTGEVFYAPFTFVVDEAGTVTGEGEAEDSFSDGQDTVTLQFTMGLEGTVDEDGDLALTAHIVFSATSTSGEEGYEEGDFSFSWKIDENGHLSGTAVWQEGQEWPVTGGAVSGGPAGLP